MEQFEYCSSLGEGAYGQVWLCKMRDSGRKVAMKRFKEAHQDPEVMRLAMREIKLLKASQHHNVVQLMEAFRSRSGRVYMVMEYVERTLTQDLRKYSRGFPPALAKIISWQLLQAVSFLHKRKVVHRDLKPANILISSDNTVKICDFGFARTLHPKETADYTTYVVTRWYRPPEVLVNDDYGPKIDVWAIGCLMCEMASGRPMFPGKTSADQLWLTMLTLGPLPSRLSNLMAEDPSYDCIKVPSPSQRTPLEQRFPYFPEELMEVVKGCLAMDPCHRLTADDALKMPYFSDVPEIMAAVAESNAVGHDFWGALDAAWQQQSMASSNGTSKPIAPQPRRSAALLRTSRSCSQRSLSHSQPLPKPTQPPLVSGNNATSSSTNTRPEVASMQGVNQLSEPQLQTQAHQAQVQQALLAQAQVQQANLKQAQQAAKANHPLLNAANLLSQQTAFLQQLPQPQQQQQQQHMQPHLPANHPSHLHQLHSNATPSFARGSYTGSTRSHCEGRSNYSMAATPSSMGVAGSSHGDGSAHGSGSFYGSFAHRPSTPGSANSSATHITAPLTPLPIQQLRRVMSNAQVSLSTLCPRTSSTGHSECPSMALLSECSSLAHVNSGGTPGGTPDASMRHVPQLSSLLTSSSRLGGSSDLGSCRLSETSTSTPAHLLVDAGDRKSFQYTEPQDSSLFSRKSLQQQQHHHHQLSTPPGSFIYASGGSPVGGGSPTRHMYSLPNMQQPAGSGGSGSQHHMPSSRRSSQVLQLQPGFPASRLSMLNSSMTSPRHRRHLSGGMASSGVPLTGSGSSFQGNLGVTKRGLTSNSMGHIAELGYEQQQLQQRQQGSSTPNPHASHATINPHSNHRGSLSIPGSYPPGAEPLRGSSMPAIPTLRAAGTSEPGSLQGGDALPAISASSKEASTVGSGGTASHPVSAFAAPSAQDMAGSGSPRWPLHSVSHPLSEEGEDGSCVSEGSKQQQQAAEHRGARQLPVWVQGRGMAAPQPQTNPKAAVADSDAGAAAKLVALDAQEDRAGAGMQQAASDAGAQGRDASGKHPSFFKLVKSRLSSLTTFKTAVKQ